MEATLRKDSTLDGELYGTTDEVSLSHTYGDNLRSSSEEPSITDALKKEIEKVSESAIEAADVAISILKE